MKCYKCCKREAKNVVPSLEKKACDYCFAGIIEKRFNKEAKRLKLSKIIMNKKRPSDEVLAHLLKKLSLRVHGLTIIESGKPNISQSTLDDVAVGLIKSFIQGKNNIIKEGPLSVISEQELISYARIEGVPFKGNKREGDDLTAHDLIMKLNSRRPGVMNSIRDFIRKLF